MKSKLGYLLSGPLTPPHQCLENSRASVFHISTHSEQTDVFWKIKSVATSPDPIDPHKTVMAEYQKTCISREADGSYKACFPWKLNHPTLPTNLTLCEKRTRALARRLATSPHLLIIYSNILNDQEQRGFIEKVKLPSVTSNCHYIPHHAVKKESPTTPIRIVYDCSCHQSNASPSLNDCLQMGAPSSKICAQSLYVSVFTDTPHQLILRRHSYTSTCMKTIEILQGSYGSQIHPTLKVSSLYIDLKLCCLVLCALPLFETQLFTTICHITLHQSHRTCLIACMWIMKFQAVIQKRMPLSITLLQGLS